MTERYTSLAFESDPSGDWVRHTDYLALRYALRDALDRWAALAVGGDMDKDRTRIAELRKFLDDK